MTLGPGTLYGAITALEHGLIEKPAARTSGGAHTRLTAARARADLTTAVRSLGAILRPKVFDGSVSPCTSPGRGGRSESPRCPGADPAVVPGED